MLEKNYFLELNEISLYAYEKCLKGDYSFTRRNKSIGDTESDSLAWQSIYDQYLKRFGIGAEYSIFLDKLEELTTLNCDLVLTGDNFLNNRIRILESEINDFNQKESIGLTEQIVIVSKWMGSRVNSRETSADEFYTMIELMKKEQSGKTKKDGEKDRR